MNGQVRKEIQDALETLNKATIDEKEEIKRIMQNRFSHAWELFNEQKGRVREKVAQGQEMITERFNQIDHKVQENPWPYMGIAAASAFVLGLLLRDHHNSR
ncbi:MAG: hypothetical protein AB1650_07815 [Candidatus Omnitrophota bacterium]